MQTYLEQAFGKSDCSSVKMRGAVREWMDLYYGASRSGEDGNSKSNNIDIKDFILSCMPN